MAHIRLAEPADLPYVRSCLAEAFEPYRADYTPAMFENTVPTIKGLLHRAANMTIWVACAPDGEVVGTIAAAVLGCTTVTLDTTAPLHRAMKFYEKHGYRQSGTRHPKLGMELIEHRKAL